MRKNIVGSALCCLLVMLLSGCQALALLEQVQMDREDSASSSSSSSAEVAPATSRPSAGGAPPATRSASVTMLVQSYEHDNIIEIPKIESAGSAAAEKINQSILEFAAKYTEYLSGHPDDVYRCEIKTYPFADDQYVQIVMTRNFYPNYGTSGDVAGFVYDIQQDAIVDMEYALEASGTSARNLEEDFKRWGGARNLFAPDAVKSFDLKAFVFTPAGARYVFEAEIYSSEAADSWKGIYTCHSESGQFYEGSVLGFLFEPGELLSIEPPLYYNRFDIPDIAGEWTSHDYETKQIKARMTLAADGSCRIQFFDTGLSASGVWESYARNLEVHLEGVGITVGSDAAIGIHAGENFYYFEPVMGGGTAESTAHYTDNAPEWGTLAYRQWYVDSMLEDINIPIGSVMRAQDGPIYRMETPDGLRDAVIASFSAGGEYFVERVIGGGESNMLSISSVEEGQAFNISMFHAKEQAWHQVPQITYDNMVCMGWLDHEYDGKIQVDVYLICTTGKALYKMSFQVPSESAVTGNYPDYFQLDDLFGVIVYEALDAEMEFGGYYYYSMG